MKLFDLNLNEPPPTDNDEPEGGPANPSMQGGQPGVRVPMFRFELSHRPPGLPRPTDVEELDRFDIVYFYTSYDNAIMKAFRDFDRQPEGGPTNPFAQGCQHVATVEPSLQPLPSRPIDAEESYDDDGGEDNEDNYEHTADNVDNYVRSSPTTFDHGPESGPTNPIAQGGPSVIPVPLAPIERSIQPQGSPSPGPIDVVELDSVDEDEDEDGDNDEEDDDDGDEDGNDDYREDSYDGYNELDVAVGDDDVIMSSATAFGQDSSSQRIQGRTPLTDSESVEIADNDDDSYVISSPTTFDHEPERGSLGIHVPLPLVEQSLQPIDMVELDSADEEVDEGDEEEDNDDYSEDGYDGHNNEGAAADVAFGQASSSRTTRGRTPLIDSESVQISDNHHHNKRRRVDSQPPVSIRDFNVHLPKPVALPPPTFDCPICMGPLVKQMAPKCGHLFCKGCIRTAIAVQPKCPICRSKVIHRELIRIYFPTCN